MMFLVRLGIKSQKSKKIVTRSLCSKPCNWFETSLQAMENLRLWHCSALGPII